MSDDAFWRFSLRVYGTPGIETICLDLQDRHGLDVNLVLFAGWLGTRGVRLTAGRRGALEDRVRPWRDQAVCPLRAVRRDLKAWLGRPANEPVRDVIEGLRDRVKRAELDAEKVEQRLLVVVAAGWPADAAPGSDLVTENLEVVHGFAGERQAFRALVEAIGPAAGDVSRPV
ncbi:MAG: TIGR02444 family protein [Geminicoccaceae bacterium]|nr:TIGR02444 family protein [Geminicoccaceae bacterium]